MCGKTLPINNTTFVNNNGCRAIQKEYLPDNLNRRAYYVWNKYRKEMRLPMIEISVMMTVEWLVERSIEQW